MKEWPLYLDDSSFLTINQLRGKARRMKDRHEHRAARHRLPPAPALRIGPGQGQPPERSRRNFARHQGAGQGTRDSDHHPRPAQPPLGGSGKAGSRRCTTCANRAPSSRMPTSCCCCIAPTPKRMRTETSARSGPVIPYILNIAKQRNGPTDRLDILFHAPYTRFDDPSGTKRGLTVVTMTLYLFQSI